MGWIEYLLIVAGSSLEIFVAMECQGSLIQKVNKKQLTAICFIVAVCQLLAMYIGYFLSSFLNGKYSVKDEALRRDNFYRNTDRTGNQAYRKGYKK